MTEALSHAGPASHWPFENFFFEQQMQVTEVHSQQSSQCLESTWKLVG